MIIWGALAIPFFGAIILLLFFKHKTVWWELLIPFAASVLLIFLSKAIVGHTMTTDTEYWGGYVTRAEYYERWNERVSCRHPKYRTETYTTRDSKGRTVTRTRQVQDGYHHAYDVDEHPPYWKVVDSNGISVSISSARFEWLCGRFKERRFVDMRRSYHTRDGDKYEATWSASKDPNYEVLEPVTSIHTYKNKVQVSDSVFNYPEVENPQEYGLFDYPTRLAEGYLCPAILGNGGPKAKEAEQKFSAINALLGPSKQVRVWVLVFKGQPLQTAMEQEAYWKGGNKNEFILTIGVNKEQKVQWCHVISWTEVDTLKIEARNKVMEQDGKVLDLESVADWLHPALRRGFIRKEFADFNYLSIRPPMWTILVTYLLVILVNVGVSAWVIFNEADESGNRRRSRFVHSLHWR